MVEFDKYWDEIHLKYTSSYDGWLTKYLDLFNKDSAIIELGCGRAYCSKYLLNNGFKNIIATDFSKEVLKIVNKDEKDLNTMLLDVTKKMPFKNSSINVVIADLSLHYFDFETTNKIFKEIYRVLDKNGYLIARVNSSNDVLHIPKDCQEIEKNFYYDGNIYKKFFEEKDFKELFKNFQICNLEEKNMDRYEKSKILWEFCIKKI